MIEFWNVVPLIVVYFLLKTILFKYQMRQGIAGLLQVMKAQEESSREEYQREMEFQREQSNLYLKEQEEYEEKRIKSVETYFEKHYSKDFITTITELYNNYSTLIDELKETMSMHFISPPSRMAQKKVEEILLSLPEETKKFKRVGRGLIQLSSDFDITITEILGYLYLRYGVTEMASVPLLVVCSNGISLRNNTMFDKGWKEDIATPELILSIAAERRAENYAMTDKLHQEFVRRLEGGIVLPRMFRELLSISRRIENNVEQLKRIALEKQEEFIQDPSSLSIVETINEYNNIYIKHLDKNGSKKNSSSDT